MAHNLEHKNGRYSFVFAGDGEAARRWHGLGDQGDPADRETWARLAGHDYNVIKVPALAAFNGNELVETEWFMLAREDNRHVFAPASKTYVTEGVQPADIDAFFSDYVAADDRFRIDAAGTLGYGERIWSTARFDPDGTGGMDVAGSRHHMRVLMSTTFDCSGATRVQATSTCVVCQNTLNLAHSDGSAAINVRHSTRFNPEVAHKQLAALAQSCGRYKALGDAMAQRHVEKKDVASFFRDLLAIPKDATDKDVSTRTKNIAFDLMRAYETTQRERAEKSDTVWNMLQAVTRYVDHDRTVRGSDGTPAGLAAARFDAGTFGSGDAMKGRAMGLLMPMLDLSDRRERVLIPA